MPRKHHNPDYEPWLSCPHTCKHPSVQNSRRPNRLVQYTYKDEVITAGDIHVYNRANPHLPAHVANAQQHPECNSDCASNHYLGKPKPRIETLANNTLGPEQWARWGLGIAIMYAGTKARNDVPERFLDEWAKREPELRGTAALVIPSIGDVGPSSLSRAGTPPITPDIPPPVDLVRMDEAYQPMVANPPSPSPPSIPPPPSPSPPAAAAPPLFPLYGQLDSADPPLRVVWVEDIARRQEFKDAPNSFIKTDIDPVALVRYKKVFPEHVYYLNRVGGKRTSNAPLPKSHGGSNALVFEYVSIWICTMHRAWKLNSRVHRFFALKLCSAGEKSISGMSPSCHSLTTQKHCWKSQGMTGFSLAPVNVL
jgi:hypothetical protein